jgi:hypothetical protein
MGDFVEALGITQQALSQRIRRGHGILVENALTISPPDEIGIASGGEVGRPRGTRLRRCSGQVATVGYRPDRYKA